MKTIKGFINSSFDKLPRRNTTPAARLAFFRAVAGLNSAPGWRVSRANMHAPDVSPLSPGFNTENSGTRYETRTPVMYGFSNGHMRRETWADEVEYSSITHRGWYTDADCSRTLRAFVFNLPYDRFGCGYSDIEAGHTVYLLKVFDSARDAAQWGDDEARRVAEVEREYNERWHAARELQDDITARKKEIARMFALRNHPTLGDDARTDLVDYLGELRTMCDRLANDYNDVEF